MSTATPLILYVWPRQWNLPSMDAGCLEAIIFLQMTCPRRFSIIETADPDLSPNGQLPFLTHHQVTVSSVPSIISYVSGLNPALLKIPDEIELDLSTPNLHLDAGISARELSKRPAWRAYIEAQLGDLLAYSFFVLEPNHNFTHSTIASLLPVPQRYYVPSRIRDTYRPRLEAAGLWKVDIEPDKPKSQFPSLLKSLTSKEETIKRTFAQVALTERARPVLDILSNLLHHKKFIFGNRASSIDIVLASRILIVTHAPLPNLTLKTLITESYPSLVSHASRVHALAFSSSIPLLIILPSQHTHPLQVLKSSLMHLTRVAASHEPESEEAKTFRLYRWGWIALAVTGAAGYVGLISALGLIRIKNADKVRRDDSGQGLHDESPETQAEEEEEEIEA
ncbi:hypothetical protein BU17DRAFT_57726 [Hysterangium stoloniferum]|nr:hypothetical protein BU17DRAFT_57726 [Hysterangium stoloniferum]